MGIFWRCSAISAYSYFRCGRYLFFIYRITSPLLNKFREINVKFSSCSYITFNKICTIPPSFLSGRAYQAPSPSVPSNSKPSCPTWILEYLNTWINDSITHGVHFTVTKSRCHKQIILNNVYFSGLRAIISGLVCTFAFRINVPFFGFLEGAQR